MRDTIVTTVIVLVSVILGYAMGLAASKNKNE
jgi:hypothetical protein